MYMLRSTDQGVGRVEHLDAGVFSNVGVSRVRGCLRKLTQFGTSRSSSDKKLSVLETARPC